MMVQWSSLATGRNIVFGVTAVTATAVLISIITRRWKRKLNYELVGHVTELNCFPVKSLCGLSENEAVCTKLGMLMNNALDRQFVIVRGENNNFVTQRQLPKMAGVKTSVVGENLVLEASGMPKIQVPLKPVISKDRLIPCRVWGVDTEGLDCGDEVANWLSTYLEEDGLKLLVSVSGLNKRPCTLPGVTGEKISYHDEAPFHICTEESLQDLNSRINSPDNVLTMKSFRPNIVVKGTKQAWDEDDWLQLKIGKSLTGRILYPCDRCLLTTVDPKEKKRREDGEPLKTLKTFRMFPEISKSPLFGIFSSVDTQGVIKVGDPVYVTRIPKVG